MKYGIRLFGALLLLAPAWAAAQDQVPSPPKQEIVTIRSAGGTLDLKATTSADLLEFTQRSVPWAGNSKPGDSAPEMSLTLPLQIEAGPNGSLEQTTALLREAVAKAFLVTVEASKDPEARVPVVTFTWGGTPTFEGVLESVSVKYTMFMPDGTAVRATVTVTIKEAGKASVKKGSAKDDK